MFDFVMRGPEQAIALPIPLLNLFQNAKLYGPLSILEVVPKSWDL